MFFPSSYDKDPTTREHWKICHSSLIWHRLFLTLSKSLIKNDSKKKFSTLLFAFHFNDQMYWKIEMRTQVIDPHQCVWEKNLSAIEKQLLNKWKQHDVKVQMINLVGYEMYLLGKVQILIMWKLGELSHVQYVNVFRLKERKKWHRQNWDGADEIDEGESKKKSTTINMPNDRMEFALIWISTAFGAIRMLRIAWFW